MTHTEPLPGTVVAPASGQALNVLGHAVTVQLSRRHAGGHYYVFSVITPPGHGIPRHVHDREDELIYVLEGTYEITLGSKRFTATAGDQIFFPRHVPHAFQNAGSIAGRTLWTVVPGGSFEDFFNKLGALPPGPPQPERVAEIFAEFGMELLRG